MSKAVRKDSTTNKMDPNNSGEEDSKKNLQVGLFFSRGKELECALMYNILQYLDLRSIQNVHSSLIKPLNKYYETEDFEKVVGLDDILKVALIYKKYSLTCPKGTPIVCACEKGNFDDVKFLWKGRRQISNDYNWISEVGTSSIGEEMTPLMAAVCKGNFKIANFLFGICKVNVNISNKEGYNAFHSVISYIINSCDNKVNKYCIEFVCELLTRMSVSNLKSENDELDAEKLVEKSLPRYYYHMYVYIINFLWIKYRFEQSDREALLQQADREALLQYNDDDQFYLESELFNDMYKSISETNSYLYNDYCDNHNDIMEDVFVDGGLPVNPTSYAVFIRVNGLHEG